MLVAWPGGESAEHTHPGTNDPGVAGELEVGAALNDRLSEEPGEPQVEVVNAAAIHGDRHLAAQGESSIIARIESCSV